ncbi:putative transposase [Oscillibacter valericigenes Sjm18-20]|nr:putative transposase [Oscillibacter valericigenes Sjm18-20]
MTDVTEFNLFGQKLYLSPIPDLCSWDIVSYSVSDKPVLSMVSQMLGNAFATISDGTNLILHSDQGWTTSTRNTKECSAGREFGRA